MTKEEIIKGIIWESYPKKQSGGQTCGRISSGATLRHEELEIEISISIHRVQLKNKEECLKLFNAYFDAMILQNIIG